MQVTRELIEQDIKASEVRLEEFKALTAQVAGALSTLKNILAYMDKPEPEKEPKAKAEEPKVEEEVSECTVSSSNQSGGVTAAQVVDARGMYHDVVEEPSSGS